MIKTNEFCDMWMLWTIFGEYWLLNTVTFEQWHQKHIEKCSCIIMTISVVFKWILRKVTHLGLV